MKKLLLVIIVACFSQAMFANAIVVQNDWRWRNDDGTETTATWQTSQNADATPVVACMTDTVRLRLGFTVGNDPGSPSNPASKTVDYHLSYGPSTSGPWTQINTSTTNMFVAVQSPYVVDGTPTTQQLTPSVAGTYASGQFIDAGHPTSITFTTPGNTTSVTEMEWVFKPTAAVTPGTYYFSLLGLTAYASTLPSMTIVGGPTASSQTVTTCDVYNSPSGNYMWTASGSYNDTIANFYGCDSVITTNLTIINSSANTITASSCGPYFSPTGTMYTSSGTYMDTIPNAAGCDSVITYNLTITNIDASVMISGATATIGETGATYQWLDCNSSMAPIAGETGQSFTATANGFYAAYVTVGTCTAFTGCYVVNVTGVEDYDTSVMSLYPNPSTGIVTLSATEQVVVEVSNSVGQVIVRKTFKGNEVIDLGSAGAGVYFVSATDANGVRSMQRVVITK